MVAVADTSLARIVAQGLVPLTRGRDPVGDRRALHRGHARSGRRVLPIG